MTSTQESFRTAQSEQDPTEPTMTLGELIKIDKPEKQLFKNLKPNTEEPEVNVDTTMVQPDMRGTPMDTQPTTMKATKLKLSPPKSFNGERDEFDGFISDVCLYLHINKDTYDTD